MFSRSRNAIESLRTAKDLNHQDGGQKIKMAASDNENYLALLLKSLEARFRMFCIASAKITYHYNLASEASILKRTSDVRLYPCLQGQGIQ